MFVKDLRAISPQLTYENEFLNGDFQVHPDGLMKAIEPSYLEFIPASLLRRMGKAVRMGIGVGLPLIKKHPSIEGIIVGTANGGLEDCIRFLNQIVEYEEGVLTPTNFVNSTPNAVAGVLAVMGEKTGYNSTHTNGSLAFDNVLMDAQLYLESRPKGTNLLIGALEEISDYNYNIDEINGFYKKEILSNEQLLASNTDGSVCGEGATMFVVSNDPTDALAELVDQRQICYPDKVELHTLAAELVESNGFSMEDVDTLIFGDSGDGRSDHWYKDLSSELFAHATYLTYKQYCGDYRTSNAFGMYLAVNMLYKQSVIHGIDLKTKPSLVLIYNQFSSARHGLILLKAVK